MREYGPNEIGMSSDCREPLCTSEADKDGFCDYHYHWRNKMQPTASDDIIWAPEGREVPSALSRVYLVHHCRHVMRLQTRRRDELDPMALGECFFCKKPMPTRSVRTAA